MKMNSQFCKVGTVRPNLNKVNTTMETETHSNKPNTSNTENFSDLSKPKN